MKYTFFLLCLLLVAFSGNSFSQDKRLTIEEGTNRNPLLFPASLAQWQWLGAGSKFVYVEKNALLSGTPGTTGRVTLLTLESLNEKLKALKVEEMKRFPSITPLGNDAFAFTSNGKFWEYNIVAGQLSEENKWAEAAENADIDYASRKVAYTKGNNLFISVKGVETAITSESNLGITYAANDVHRNEFGISKGTFWSPKANLIAFYRMDQTMVTDYPLVNITTRIATLENTRYPMAGMTSHHVTVGVYNLTTGKTTYLQTENSFASSREESGNAPELDHYLTNITWSPDEKVIYVAELNRDQNHMQLNQYDATSGAFLKTLFEETSQKYVEPQNGPLFMDGDPSTFIWQSQRDGFNHLYLYSSTGNLIKQLTTGSWVVKSLVSFNRKANLVYFMANKDNPLDNQLYTVNMKTLAVTRITQDAGTHSVKVSQDGKYILDNFSSYSVASQYTILNESGKVVETLVQNDNPLKEYTLGETSVFAIQGDGNTDLWCRLIKPVGFDPAKKYPVVIYVYGGPHSQLVTDSWLGGGGLFLNYLASQGYVVFTLDNRGTANRGLAFEQAIFRNLGLAEVADQMKGVQYLKSQPWVDTTRIGINGWSYGGFMGLSMMLKNPGVFKVVVVGGPVIDWKYYEVMYGERYMDTPESNPEGYKNANLLNYTLNLKGKLLILQGYQDRTVVPQNGLTFVKKCVEEGIQLDYFLYPGHEHNVRGKDRVHMNRKIVNYFDDYLK
jgi:dipeptidyl-peptidase-4